MRGMTRRFVLLVAAVLSLVPPARGVQKPQGRLNEEKAFRHPGLHVPELHHRVADLEPTVAQGLDIDLADLGATSSAAFYDSRVGRLSGLLLSVPLIPGTGVRNTLSWVIATPRNQADLELQAGNAVRSFLIRQRTQLRIDPAELGPARTAAYERGGLVQIYFPRIVGGLVVRDNSITAVLNHGNLVLLGLQNWGDVRVPLAPTAAAAQAQEIVREHVRPFEVASFVSQPELELIPMESEGWISYRLAWTVGATVAGDMGTWEGLVDALTGELLAFEDRNQYARQGSAQTRTVSGGVYPVANDQTPPDGVEQPGWPMPYVGVVTAGETVYSDGGGNFGCLTGSIQTALAGLFVKMLDTCGAVDEASVGQLDLGSGPTATATDCSVPVGHSAGDTKASRTAYYELNRIIEQAKGHLPGNSWLQAQLTVNTNLDPSCNAFWNGATLNFFKDAGSSCRNTGEIAGLLDHEWAHGMDNNGVNPTSSLPAEAIGDIYAILRLDESCMGRGFLKAGDCSGYGDACTSCSGVRELDFANHVSGLPHDLAWITASCPAGSGGPCGRVSHCEAQIPAETAWDLQLRDLQGPPFNLDPNTALELTTRLFFLGSQAITSWYTCAAPGGCGATGGYLQVLAVDDDNGNLLDGTPHMSAIFAAFERHEIHCATPSVFDSGCAGAPTGAPALTATASDTAANLSWTAVSGATRYVVYRTDGVAACNFGKSKVGETTDTAFRDTGLQNGRTYSYTVAAVGSTDACRGPMSVCQAVTPAAGMNLAVFPDSELELAGGDGDAFLDNCELGTITFHVANTGTGTLTNIRLVSVVPLTHPSTFLAETLPVSIAGSLAQCEEADASIRILPRGMLFGEETQLQLDVTTDEIAPQTRSLLVTIPAVETDTQSVASRTYSFETDLEGWSVVSGTFTRQSGGGGDGVFHVSSSEFLDNACDIVRSPTIRLKDTSTLSLSNAYVTEEPVPVPYDRANVGVVDLDTSARTTIVVSGGRPYDILPGAANGSCVTKEQAGWAGSRPAFAQSVWHADALNPGGIFTGKRVRLEVAYGTDGAASLAGFDFDAVTITDFEELLADTQSDTCALEAAAAKALSVDASGNGVLEPNEVVVVAPTWQNVGFGPLSLAGAASSFAGPPGPAYGLADAAAAYGTIAVGDSAACADCYSLGITTGTRPVQHWDASVLETLTTSATKTWSLHVGDSFGDTPTSHLFYPFIENIFHNGVTGGCGGTDYCPGNSTLRQQMAVFVLKAREGSAYTPPPCIGVFVDVPCPSLFADWIEELFNRGVVAGCAAPGGPNYCPTAPVLRQQMAVFLLRTLLGPGYVPPTCTGMFPDVPCPSTFAAWIEDLANRSITGGCGGGNYCPGNPTTRGQMAVFIQKTFSLLLYRP